MTATKFFPFSLLLNSLFQSLSLSLSLSLSHTLALYIHSQNTQVRVIPTVFDNESYNQGNANARHDTIFCGFGTQFSPPPLALPLSVARCCSVYADERNSIPMTTLLCTTSKGTLKPRLEKLFANPHKFINAIVNASVRRVDARASICCIYVYIYIYIYIHINSTALELRVVLCHSFR